MWGNLISICDRRIKSAQLGRLKFHLGKPGPRNHHLTDKIKSTDAFNRRRLVAKVNESSL